VLGQLLLAASAEWLLPALRDPPYGDKERVLLRRLAGRSRRPVVMLGSSRTLYALRGRDAERALPPPDAAPVVFNFGLSGAGPLMELLTLRRLVADGIKPQLLLVEVHAPSLAGQVELADFGRMTPERLAHTELSLVERYMPGAHLRSRWWTNWLLPCYSHRFTILSELLPQVLPTEERMDWLRGMDDSGWCALPELRRCREEEGRRFWMTIAHHEYDQALSEFRLGGPGPAALRELLALCRQHAIPTVLVLMPEGDEFRSWYPSAAWAQVESFLAELHCEFDVDVINARDWLAEQDFADSHHQFPEGAKRFSERLAREVIAPRLHQPAAPARDAVAGAAGW
jgi:hypothetical protein